MKLYDIALVLIRALVVMDFVRAVLSLVVDDVVALSMMAQTAGIWPALTLRWQAQAFQIGAAVLLWFLSKPMARFATRFVEASS
jgi:hypothetical protein